MGHKIGGRGGKQQKQTHRTSVLGSEHPHTVQPATVIPNYDHQISTEFKHPPPLEIQRFFQGLSLSKPPRPVFFLLSLARCERGGLSRAHVPSRISCSRS